MNPHDELRALVDLFPEPEPLVASAEHIPSATTPEPYRTLLVHDAHMTVSMERLHGGPVEVRVLNRRLDGDLYARESLLLVKGTDRVVQLGIVRFDLRFVDPEVRAEILSETIPLGRVLIDHGVLRHIDLGAILRLTAGPALARHLRMPVGAATYGRLATIFCNGRPAVDLLEISAPLPPAA